MMSEQLNEFLSAAADGEAEAFELRRVLDEAKRDANLASTWERYHLIGHGIRGELPPVSQRSMADAVWASCFDDAATAPALKLATAAAEGDAGTTAAGSRSWGGLAMAAGVAAVAVAGVLLVGVPATETAPATLAENTSSAGAITIDGPVLPVPSEISEQDVQRANAYMLHHVQQRGLNQAGLASFVKVATFDAKE